MRAVPLQENATPAYRQSAQEVLKGFATDASRGLDSQEARARLERYGRRETHSRVEEIPPAV